jgi:hypothetical protein
MKKIGKVFGVIAITAISVLGCANLPPVIQTYADPSTDVKQQAMVLLIGTTPCNIVGVDSHMEEGDSYSIIIKRIGNDQVGIIPTGTHEFSIYANDRNGRPVTTKQSYIKISGTVEAGKKYIIYCDASTGEFRYAEAFTKFYTYDDFFAWFGKENPKKLEQEKAKVTQLFSAAESYLANPPIDNSKK